MSFDDPADNADFKAEHGFQYELWSDTTRALAMHLGAASSDTQAFADRKTYVLDEQGRLCLKYDTVSVSPHPQDVLDDVTLLLQAP